MSDTCKKVLWGGPGMHGMFRRGCSRKAVIDGYCKQHAPKKEQSKQ